MQDTLTPLLIETLRSGTAARFVARGWSMHPFIQDRDTVEIEPCAPDALRRGDIGAFLLGDTVALHRFVTRSAEGLLFRGDACRAMDPPVPPEAVLGVVTRVDGSGWLACPRRPLARALGATYTLFAPLLHRLSGGKSALVRILRGGTLPSFGGPELARDRALLACIAGEPFDAEALPVSAECPEVATLLPMLAHTARARRGGVPGAALPASLLRMAEELELAALHRSAREEALLRSLSAVLSRTGDELLLVKGAALAIRGVYPAPHLRPAADIDTLCRPGAERSITARLLAEGWTHAEPEYPPEHYFRFRTEIALRAPEPHWPPLEIHWQTCGRMYFNRGLPLARMWEASTALEGLPGLRVLEPDMEAVFSVAHLTKHLRHLRPLWALDFMLLSQQGLDWDRVAALLKETRLVWPGWMVLEWVAARAPGTVPGNILARLRASCRTTPASLIELRALLSESERMIALLEALYLPSWPQRAGGLKRLFFPERHVLERLFPDHATESAARLHLRRFLRIFGRLTP